MARPTRRADEASPKDMHELGVRGRKTGVTLRGRGRLDEFGMLPLADISSSPVPNTAQNEAPLSEAVQEPVSVPAPAPEPILQATPVHQGNDSGSDAMDIPSSKPFSAVMAALRMLTSPQGPGPGPRTILRKRSISIGLPKSRSPVKTHAKSLRSPAKRNPNLSPRRMSSTPTDPSIVKQPDFANLPAQSGGSKRLPVISEPRSDSNSISSSDDHMEISDMVEKSKQMPTRSPEQPIGTANDYRPRISQKETTPVGMSDKAKGKQKALAIDPIAQVSPRRPASVRRPPSPQQLVQEPESSLYVPYDPDPSPSPEPAQPDYSSPPEPLREPSITKPSPVSKPPKRKTPVMSALGDTKRRPYDDGEDAGENQEKRQRRDKSAVSRQSEQPVKRGRGRPPKNGIAKRGPRTANAQITRTSFNASRCHINRRGALQRPLVQRCGLVGRYPRQRASL
ncbi:hypothetical protein NQ176_g11217 [Zarea fungicola]|uniref:Uncharacterized protein n=1 Tax=Zarea fungicola TaxID=93591 RepID=A0ACC1MDJ1_9HYPO|nr:hypothetical protein NQ176_g11217 [Lecanicillium fungicola]